MIRLAVTRPCFRSPSSRLITIPLLKAFERAVLGRALRSKWSDGRWWWAACPHYPQLVSLSSLFTGIFSESRVWTPVSSPAVSSLSWPASPPASDQPWTPRQRRSGWRWSARPSPPAPPVSPARRSRSVSSSPCWVRISRVGLQFFVVANGNSSKSLSLSLLQSKNQL